MGRWFGSGDFGAMEARWMACLAAKLLLQGEEQSMLLLQSEDRSLIIYIIYSLPTVRVSDCVVVF